LTLSSTGAVTIQEDSGTVLVGDNSASVLQLKSSQSITQSNTSTMTAGSFSAESTGNIELYSPNNWVTTIAFNSISGSVLFYNQNQLTVGTVGQTFGVTALGTIELKTEASLALNQNLKTPLVSGVVRLQAGTTISQNIFGAIIAQQLSTKANGEINLTYADNSVKIFAASSAPVLPSITGSILYRNTNTLTIGTVSGGTCVTASQTGVTAAGANSNIELTADELLQDAGTIKASLTTLTALSKGIGSEVVCLPELSTTGWNQALAAASQYHLNVTTSKLQIFGPTTTGNHPVNGSVWIELNPLTENSTIVKVSKFAAAGDVVLTSGKSGVSGELQLPGISSDCHILIYSPATQAAYAVNVAIGQLSTTSTADRAIGVDIGGEISKLSNYQIKTGNMNLLQLQPNQIIQNPDGTPLVTSVASQLSEIYKNYQFFQIQKTYPKEFEAIIRPSETTSILTTIGIPGETGWNIQISWGDGTSTSYRSIINSQAAPLIYSHVYTPSVTTIFTIILNISVDPSIHLATHAIDNSGSLKVTSTYFESRSLVANVMFGAAPPSLSIFATHTTPIATPIPPIPFDLTNFSQTPVNAPEEIRLTSSPITKLRLKKNLYIWTIPEDSTRPLPVVLPFEGSGDSTTYGMFRVSQSETADQGTTAEIPLLIFADQQFLEKFQYVPDGRYELKLLRFLGEDLVDERTLLETVITDGIPSNPLVEEINRLRDETGHGKKEHEQIGSELEPE